MCNKNSFDLVKEQEKTKKKEKMYAAPSCRCMRFIAVPALVGFMLLLILVNVDFNGVPYEPYENTTEALLSSSTVHANARPTASSTRQPLRPATSTTKHTTGTHARETKTMPMSSTQTPISISIRALDDEAENSHPTEGRIHSREMEAAALQPRTASSTTEPTARLLLQSSGSYCRADDNTNCSITCTGDVFNVNLELETYYCSTTLNVILRDCDFPSGELDKNFFIGSYVMRSLVIEDCNLKKIAAEAFKKPAVAKLDMLTLINTHLTELTKPTFGGLQNLRYFKLINVASVPSFRGHAFLSPMANTLNETVLQVQSRSTAYDPKDWLAEAYFTLLEHVDFSGNLFPQTLNNESFVHIWQVRVLILAHCGIQSIGKSTFDGLMASLVHLDLRHNKLQTLDADFLTSIPITGFRLEISHNAWSCTCDNLALVSAIQDPAVSFAEVPNCSAPEEWRDQSMLTVTLTCESNGLTLPPLASTTSTGAWNTTQSGTTPDAGVESASTESESNETSESSSSGETEEMETDPTDSTEITESTTLESIHTTITQPQQPTTTETIPPTFTTTTTTTSSTTTSITPPKNVILKCTTTDPNKWYTPSIRDFAALFRVYTATARKVVLRVQGDMNEMKYFYFIGNSSTAGYQRRARFRDSVSTTSSYDIDGLLNNENYLFCLIPDAEKKVSPFDCRAHYLDEHMALLEPWLFASDTALFISLSVLGTLVALCVGVALIYVLLRWRPTLLKGSRRLLRVEHDCHKVYLLPCADYDIHSVECPYACSYHVNMDPSVEVGTRKGPCQCKPTARHSKADYMQYYKGLQLSRLQRSEQFVEHKPPMDRAPSIPSHSDSGRSSLSRPTSSQSTARADDFICDTQAPRLDYEYQSLEVYEEIF